MHTNLMMKLQFGHIRNLQVIKPILGSSLTLVQTLVSFLINYIGIQ
jgi:hypothetical protein